MITLPQEYERMIASLLEQGKFASSEEILARVFAPLRQEAAQGDISHSRAKTPAEAVDDILKLRENLTLGGVKIRELIDEGRH